MSDWNDPNKDSQYLALLEALKARDIDVASMATPVNPPVWYKRWNGALGRIEEWDGTAWLPLPMLTEWLGYGHTPLFRTSSSFTLDGLDATSLYPVGRAVRLAQAGDYLLGRVTRCFYADDGVMPPYTLVELAMIGNGLLTSAVSGLEVFQLSDYRVLPQPPAQPSMVELNTAQNAAVWANRFSFNSAF